LDQIALYYRRKGNGKNKLFYDVSNRRFCYLEECSRHENLSDLEISDVGRFRDYLFARGMSSSSVKQVFSSVKLIVNLAIKEKGLTVTDVFSGTFIPDDGAKQRRSPIPTDALQHLQLDCQNLDDASRWSISLISDTIMRLSEDCGLLFSDIHFDTAAPCVDLIEHPWRRLKKASS